MRARIQWVGVVAAALAIGLFGVPLAVAVVVLLRADERGELDRVAETTAVRVAADLAAGRTPTQLPEGEDGMHVAVYGLPGRRLLGTGPDAADAPVRQAIAGATAGGSDAGDFVVATPVTSNNRLVGVVRTASPQSRVWLKVGLTWLAMAGLAAAAVAAAALLARRQSRRLAAPLERLAAAAQTLGDGDFTVRLPPAGIPEIDAAAGALTKTAERLGDLVARERAFSADASHQLRTPLTGLRLRLETALEGDGDLRNAAEGALDTADRLERTIDELLALARDAPHARTPADLPALLVELRSSWGAPLTAAGRTLQLTLEPELSGTRASATAVRHILDVLLANAQRHGAGAVSIVVRDADTAIAIDVGDQGPGVAEPEELFRRRTSRAAGHGIGLALARALAEAEGGRLLLSRPGPGPVFTLLLPAETSSPADRRPSGSTVGS
jgi:signal transduction histidine kinase